MKQIIIILFLAVIAVEMTPAQNLPDRAKGIYTTSIAGAKIAEESYLLENMPNNIARLTSEMSVGGAQTTLVTTIENNHPREFSIETGGTKALTTTFDGGEARFNIAGQPAKTIKSEAQVVLENLVWSQFIQLLGLYDARRGGEQHFVGLLPSKMLELHLTLSKTGTQSHELNRQNIEIERYRLAMAEGSLVADIWASKNFVPLLIEVPAQQIKVVRRGFEDLPLLLSPQPEKAREKTFKGEFTSEEVEFTSGAGKLAGTLTLPKNNQKTFPGVILISGSGGQDRDGSTLNNLYKQIAESLSQTGIAVLRVDDRGTGKSALPVGVETSYQDLIADSGAAFDYLIARKEIDKAKIAFLGHSEGAETALTLASDDKRIAALMLLAGTSRPADEVVLEQEMFQRASTETINASDKSKVMPLAQILMRQFDAAKLPQNAANPKLAWFREHSNSNPSALAQKIACPVLIVQGERDALVLPGHAIALAEAFAAGGNKNVSLRILPNTTHLFTTVGSTTVNADLLKTLQNWASTNLIEKF